MLEKLWLRASENVKNDYGQKLYEFSWFKIKLFNKNIFYFK